MFYLPKHQKRDNIYMIDLKKTHFKGDFLNLFLFFMIKGAENETRI